MTLKYSDLTPDQKAAFHAANPGEERTVAQWTALYKDSGAVVAFGDLTAKQRDVVYAANPRAYIDAAIAHAVAKSVAVVTAGAPQDGAARQAQAAIDAAQLIVDQRRQADLAAATAQAEAEAAAKKRAAELEDARRTVAERTPA